MTPTRETIVAALLTKLKSIVVPVAAGQPAFAFQTIARTWKGIDEAVRNDRIPALVLIETAEDHTVKSLGMPAIIDVPFDIFLVVKNPDGPVDCSTINPVLEALDTLLLPNVVERIAGNRVTLGGLVYHVWIAGKIQKNPSYLNGAASVAAVPLHVRVTNPF